MQIRIMLSIIYAVFRYLILFIYIFVESFVRSQVMWNMFEEKRDINPSEEEKACESYSTKEEGIIYSNDPSILLFFHSEVKALVRL